ncbi:sugar ABC transporter permease [Candidatus Villigracilis affinis]|uniref:sugar ABC transporter permease n=1 Tax=Candidatus Villigracilis affinis TaxID=3140682 RepID=UPI002A1B8408|nr:sugar ABC transporter permease [Anaerolineales bacterium]
MGISNQTVQDKTSFKSELFQVLRLNVQTYTILLALIGIWAIFFFTTKGTYLAPQNISNLFRQMSVTAFLAAGMVLVIVTGNIDLSVGKLAGFVSVVAAYLQANFWYKYLPDQPLLSAVLTVIASLLVGSLFGAIQGYIISFLRVPSFIVTLGGQWLLTGLILLVTAGKTIPANQPWFSDIAQGYVPVTWGWIFCIVAIAFLFWNMFRSRQNKRKHGFELQNIYIDLLAVVFAAVVILVYVYNVNSYKGIQNPVLLLAITAMIMIYVSNNTRFGRYSYAIGGNRDAARLSGISISGMVFKIFVLMGFLSGVGGVVLASYVGYGTTAAGAGYELDAIAACILGGTSTLGGIGTIQGAMIGALIIASLSTGLQMMNVAPAWQYVLKAIVLVLAVLADVYFKKNR